MSTLIQTLDPNPYERNECRNCGKETYNIEMGCWTCEDVYCVRCYRRCNHNGLEERLETLYDYLKNGGYEYKLAFLSNEKYENFIKDKYPILKDYESLLVNLIEDNIIWRM